MSDKAELKAYSELKGNTLLVYLYLLKSQTPVGPREIQRKLNFSSPTLAAYHLAKLETLGLIQKAPEGYSLAKEVKVGALSQIIKFGSLLLPRYVFYLGLFCAMLISYLLFSFYLGLFEINMHSSFAMLIGVTIVIVMVYECLRIWKEKL